jgi:hypothetical protein
MSVKISDKFIAAGEPVPESGAQNLVLLNASGERTKRIKTRLSFAAAVRGMFVSECRKLASNVTSWSDFAAKNRLIIDLNMMKSIKYEKDRER